MVCAPAIFLVGLGVHARSIADDFETVANDFRTEASIQAYVPFVRDAQAALKEEASDQRHWRHQDSDSGSPVSFEQSRPTQIRVVAREWLAGAQRGRLKPLTPIAYEDNSSEGLKSQIFEAQTRMASILIDAGERDASAGDNHSAIADTALACRLSQILKHSDFVSLFDCANLQRRALIHLAVFEKGSSAADRKIIASVAREARTNTALVERMTSKSKQLFFSWCQRTGLPQLSIQDTEFLASIPVLVRDDKAVAIDAMKPRLLASREGYVKDYYSSVRLGLHAQAQLDKAIARR